MEANVPYDDGEFAAVKMKNLDRDATETWNEGVDGSAKPNLRPAGYLRHMSEKWKRALEADDDVSSSGEESVADDDVSSSGEESVADAGVEICRDLSAAHNSLLEPLPQGKSKKADWDVSISVCAEGKRRRRIEGWTRQMRPIEP